MSLPEQLTGAGRLFFTVAIYMIFITNNIVSAGPTDHPWCYKDSKCAPSHWAGQCQTGTTQSPIDFNTRNIIRKKEDIRMRFNREYMDVQKEFYIKNNGHTVQAQLKPDLSSDLLMDGDGLKGSYVLSQLHFHWGSHDDVGSEHTVNGNAYPIELHLVHYGQRFKSLTEAASDSNHRALAVLGIFFEISSSDNPALEPIIDVMNRVEDVSDNLVKVQSNLNISALLPHDLALFRYYGSLTTPSCNEIVHWNVFQKAVPISRTQLSAFRNLMDSHHAKLVDNYRPTQPIGTRKVQEFDNVRRGVKPDSGATDDRSPSPDADYDEAQKGFKNKPSEIKKNSAPSQNFGSSCIIIITTSLFIALYRNSYSC